MPPINVGIIHSHANYDPRYENEQFSPADKAVASSYHLPIYVSTPGGTLQVFDPSLNKSKTLSISLPK
jgi:hypothetical protein